MVQHQLRARGIDDGRVLDLMAEIPREAFMPPERRHTAYCDGAQPIGLGQTISQPYVVALMTQALNVRPDHRVLEIGTGSGYQTAILARLADHVYSIERLEDLTARARKVLRRLQVDNVTLHVGDGTLGWDRHAPFDRVLCGAGSPDVPPDWIDQLADGGRIVLPVGSRQHQQLIQVDKRGDRIERSSLCEVRFVPLIGQQGWP